MPCHSVALWLPATEKNDNFKKTKKINNLINNKKLDKKTKIK